MDTLRIPDLNADVRFRTERHSALLPLPLDNSLDSRAFAEDAIFTDPSVDPTAIVPDLKPLALNRFDQMQVLLAIYFAEHDVTHLKGSKVHRLDRTELPRFDLAPHGMPPGTKLNRFPILQASDILSSPSHLVPFPDCLGAAR